MIKENDFIEMEYTGRLKEGNTVFDTTNQDVAKESGMFNPQAKYRPITVEIGKGHLIKGLDREIVGKVAGKDYDFEFEAIDAFGKKDAKLLKMVPKSEFVKQKIQPHPGLQLNIDNQICTVKTVSGGRIVVDFNHPLSGKNVIYNVKINKVINDNVQKAKAILTMELQMNEGLYEISENDGKLTIKLDKNLPVEAVGKAIEQRLAQSNITSVEVISKE